MSSWEVCRGLGGFGGRVPSLPVAGVCRCGLALRLPLPLQLPVSQEEGEGERPRPQTVTPMGSSVCV